MGIRFRIQGLFGLEDFHRNFKGIPFLCFADIIHRLEWRKAANHSRGKELLASQNMGKITSTPNRGFAEARGD
jgi:hypothetical protein